MKSYFFIILFFVIQISAMEVPTGRAIVESKSSLFLEGNTMYKDLACCYLKDSGISLKDKFILDIASKTGEISHLMAQRAELVMAIDADKNMVDCANKLYGKQPNLSFHQDCLEKIEPSNNSLKFNVATLFNGFDLIDDKREACKKIHQCLCPNGEVLVNVGPGKEPFDFEVVREMVKSIPLMRWIPGYSKLESLLGDSYLKEEDYRKIFEDSGFYIVTFTRRISTCIFENSEQVIAMKRPIVMNKPAMQRLPGETAREWVFGQFMTKLLTKLQQTEEGHYLYPVEEILIHARKSEKK